MSTVYIQLAVFTLIFAFGFILVTYEQFAVSRTWFIEPSLRGNSFVKLAGVFSIFMAPGLAFHFLPWWQGLVVVVAGLILFPGLISLFKSRSQYVAAGGVVIGWLVCFVTIAGA